MLTGELAWQSSQTIWTRRPSYCSYLILHVIFFCVFICISRSLAEKRTFLPIKLLENVQHCGGEPEQTDAGILCHW